MSLNGIYPPAGVLCAYGMMKAVMGVVFALNWLKLLLILLLYVIKMSSDLYYVLVYIGQKIRTFEGGVL